jgi:RNA polymerase sigma-70 factor (ECF subfamily)
LCLAAHAGGDGLDVIQPGALPEDLERHVAVEGRVVRRIHEAHPAVTDERAEDVAIDAVAGLERLAVGGVGTVPSFGSAVITVIAAARTARHAVQPSRIGARGLPHGRGLRFCGGTMPQSDMGRVGHVASARLPRVVCDAKLCADMGGVSLSAIFSQAGGACETSECDLERELASRVEAGRARWPHLVLEETAFVRHVATHSLNGRLPPFDHTADLWLACACTNGAEHAARAFERQYRTAIENAVARVDRRLVDEATQRVFTSLLVSAGDRPGGIARYGGRSALSTWLATVAARTTIKLRGRFAARPCDRLCELAHGADSDQPDLLLARARYGRELDASLRTAIAALVSRERLLLRLHHVDGWSIDRVAALYRVSRATTARWLAAARKALYEATKRDLRARLSVTSREADSLAALVVGDVELSLGRLLTEGYASQRPPTR